MDGMGWDGMGWMGWIGSPGGRGYRAPYGANNVTGERNRMPWKTQLNDGCTVLTSEGWSGEPEGEFDPSSKTRLFQPLLKAMGSL